MTNPKNHYTFGDSDRAKRRLALLARAYSDATRAFVARHAPAGLDTILDLGCGPGHTTRLIREVSGSRRAVGIDASPAQIEAARSESCDGTEYVCHDLLELPYPVPPARLVFSRFLLTHVSDARDALTRFRQLVAPGGALLLQETSHLRAAQPAIARYYELVGDLQAHYAQELYIGSKLADLARDTPFGVEHFADRRFTQPAAVMAELHALNVGTWKDDPYARVAFDRAELEDLEARLFAIASSNDASTPVEVGLGELVLRAPT